jgi:hypothetical protein
VFQKSPRFARREPGSKVADVGEVMVNGAETLTRGCALGSFHGPDRGNAFEIPGGEDAPMGPLPLAKSTVRS